jgi:hypothetical protein
MRMPGFTLIYRDRPPAMLQKRAQKLSSTIARAQPAASRKIRSLNPIFRRSLLTSVLSPQASVGNKAKEESLLAIRQITTDLSKAKKPISVGIWDTNLRAGGDLAELIATMNRAQMVWTFFEVQAAVPTGLVSQPERLAEWASETLGRALRKSERQRLKSHIIGDKFFERAEIVRKGLGIDYLIALTTSLIATKEGSRSIEWESYSDSRSQALIVSTFHMREMAKRAGRKHEAFIGELILSQMLVVSQSDVEYHAERGCLFDEGSRRALETTLRNPEIEPKCYGLIKKKYREAAVVLLYILKQYGRQ